MHTDEWNTTDSRLALSTCLSVGRNSVSVGISPRVGIQKQSISYILTECDRFYVLFPLACAFNLTLAPAILWRFMSSYVDVRFLLHGETEDKHQVVLHFGIDPSILLAESMPEQLM